MLSRYHALVIPHSAQRYNTVGDYYYPYIGTLEVRISDLKNTDYEFLVLIHELIEAHLCASRGISESEITLFDLAHPEVDEPGDLSDAPYHAEHTFATHIEHEIAKELKIDWDAYDDAVLACCEAGQGPDPEQGLEQFLDASSSAKRASD
jgi:hypothetical protein